MQMIGISIAANREWRWVLERFKITSSDCQKYPFGEYFKKNTQDIIEIQKMAKEVNQAIEDNPVAIINLLTELLKEF